MKPLTVFILGVLLMALGCGQGKSRNDDHPVIASYRPQYMMPEHEARELFEEQIVAPLQNWSFDRDSERYFVLDMFDEDLTPTFTYVQSYEARDLEWEVYSRDSATSPYGATVSFISDFRLYDSGRAPLLPPHPHTHTYLFKEGKWILENQSYRVGSVTADCIVGHIRAVTWHVEAMCVDEAIRLIGEIE